MTLLGVRAGHSLHLNKIEPADFMIAMILNFQGDEGR
jgi:hypothetical protein